MCVSQVVFHMFPKRGNLTMHLQHSCSCSCLLGQSSVKSVSQHLAGFHYSFQRFCYTTLNLLFLVVELFRRPENWKHFCLLFCCWCFSFLNIWLFTVSLLFLLNKCFFYIYNNKQKFSFLRWISDTLYFYCVTLVEWLSLIHSWFIDSCHRSWPCCSSSVHPLSEPSCSSSLLFVGQLSYE